jgi:hypothetical protein
MLLNANSHKKRAATKPISIRLSPEERSLLENAAGKRSLSEFIRERIFAEQTRYRRVRNPKIDARLLAQLLGRLGQSELAANLRKIAWAINAGSVPVTPETEKSLQAASVAVIEMRDQLVRALGLVETPSP